MLITPYLRIAGSLVLVEFPTISRSLVDRATNQRQNRNENATIKTLGTKVPRSDLSANLMAW